MKSKSSLYRNLSLDVVLGAMASGSMIAWMLEVSMPWIWWVAFPMAVWVIYTSDHLLDAYRLKDRAHTPRHLFHHRYFRPIVTVWLILLLSCLSWVAYLSPVEMLYLAVGMGLLVLLHLALVKLIGKRISLWFVKESGVGIIYATGVWGGVLILHPQFLHTSTVLMYGQFLLLAMINLFFFSMYESETDQRDGHTSFVLAIGLNNTRKLIAFLALLVFLLGVFLCLSQPSLREVGVEGIYLLMLIGLLLISFYPQWFAQNERYRAWGDGMFLLPALVWIMEVF